MKIGTWGNKNVYAKSQLFKSIKFSAPSVYDEPFDQYTVTHDIGIPIFKYYCSLHNGISDEMDIGYSYINLLNNIQNSDSNFQNNYDLYTFCIYIDNS